MAATDTYAGRADVSTQGDRWAAVALDTPFVIVPKAIWANVAGDIAMEGDDGVAVTFTVPAGTPIPLRPRRILTSGTTATGIKAIF